MLCFFYVAGWASTSAYGQPLRVDPLLVSGRRALLDGDDAGAIELLERAIDRNGASAEAHYLVAQAFLSSGQVSKAHSSIRKARALDDDNLKYAVAELEILRIATPRESSISITDGRRITLANHILEEDPDNAAALEELGIHHAANYRWYANFDATRAPLGSGVRSKALEEFDTACRHLRRAVAIDSERASAYGELLRLLIHEGQWTDASTVAEIMIAKLPRSPEPWLYAGLIAQLQHQSEKAAPFFSRALELMEANDRRAFLNVSLFRTRLQAPMSASDYWAERDPFRLTGVNERLMDHYARMAYADLWYGNGRSPGWNTERGRIVLRYGIPWSDATFIGGYSRFNVLEYRDFEFVFEDQTRGGHYTMYSPKAGASSSWTGDYVIQAAEMAISNPEQYDPRLRKSIDLLAETSAFRGADGAQDVYVHILVPAVSADDDSLQSGVVGVFAVDSTRNEINRATTRLPESGASADFTTGELTLALHNTTGADRVEIEYLSDDRASAGKLSIPADWPRFAGDSLSASDLLAAGIVEDSTIASPGKTGRVERSGYSIEPMNWGQLDAGSDLLIYFELYGLAVDEKDAGSYRLDAILRPLNKPGGISGLLSGIFGRSDGGSVTVSIEAASKGPDEARFVSIGLPAGASGRHEIEILVTDLRSGDRVSRRHALSIG